MNKKNIKSKKNKLSNLEAVRTHDQMYLKLDRSKQVKHSFLKILEEIKNYRIVTLLSVCESAKY